MPGNELAVLVDQARTPELKRHNTIGDLPNLFCGVRAQIARIRLNLTDQHHLHGHAVLLGVDERGQPGRC